MFPPILVYGDSLKWNEVVETRVGDKLVFSVDADFFSEQVLVQQYRKFISPLGRHPAFHFIMFINNEAFDRVSVFDSSYFHIL